VVVIRVRTASRARPLLYSHVLISSLVGIVVSWFGSARRLPVSEPPALTLTSIASIEVPVLSLVREVVASALLFEQVRVLDLSSQVLIEHLATVDDRTTVLKDLHLLDDQLSRLVLTFYGAVDRDTHFSSIHFGVLHRVDLDLSAISLLTDVLHHTASSSDDFGHIVCWDGNREGHVAKVLAYRLVVVLQSPTELLDASNDVLESSFHRADALVVLQQPIVVVLVAPHVDAKLSFEVLGEVAVLSYDEAACLRLHDELRSQIDIFSCDGLSFCLVPVLDEVSLLFQGVVHDLERFGKLIRSAVAEY